MSEEDASPQPGRLRRAWRGFTHLHEWHLVQTLVALATIVALAVAAVPLLSDSDSSTASPAPSATPTAEAMEPAAQTMSPPGQGPATEQPAAEPSQCWTATGEQVPCSASHSVEVVALALAECTQESLVRHMGGDPRLDVTRVDVGVQTVGGGEVCVALGSEEWTGPLEGALMGPSSDALRLCEDTRSATRSVGCDAVHTVEAVGPTRVGPADVDCAAEVEDYTGVPADRLDVRLKVLVRTSADSGATACAITVSGGDVLTASLRSIGSQAIPITAG